MASSVSELADVQLTALQHLIWPADHTDDEVQRWHEQGFVFCDTEGVRFGLRQRSGGPCGILAPLQALIIKELLFEHGEAAGSEAVVQRLLRAAPERVEAALINALAHVLWQAASAPGSPGMATLVTSMELPITMGTSAAMMAVHTFATEAALAQALREHRAQLASDSGVMLFLFSLLLSRGLEQVAADMDDNEHVLGRFGHCSQDLLNLVLCGQAVSNVFDGCALPCCAALGCLRWNSR